MIILNRSINTMWKYATWLQIALSFILKMKKFKNILQIMLKEKLYKSNYKVNCPKEKVKKLLH